MSYVYVDSLAGDDGLEGLEGMGDEDIIAGLAADELGARAAARRRAPGRFGGAFAGRPGMRPGGVAPSRGGPSAMPVAQLMAPISGVPQRGLRKSWLPMGALNWVAGSAATQTLTVQPQKPFRPTRQVFATTRTGATATGLLTLGDLSIGQNRQPAAPGAAPIDAFGPTAFDVDVDLDPANTSINVVASITTSVVPGAADRIDLSGMLVGYMIG